MAIFTFRFPAGRYHATPWGQHVNEGQIEWPPSPWRILRALLATGFSKLRWREPPDAARALIEAFAQSLPSYSLPPATTGHTRHWMPSDDPSPEKRSRVIDAFVSIGKDALLGVSWHAELSRESEELLELLVARMSYLGRAESSVEGRLASALPNEGEAVVADETNRPGFEPIPLLAPLPPADYEAWRSTVIGRGDVPRPRSRGASGSVPSDLLAALLVDTSFLQKHGWSQPPGSKRAIYARPMEALQSIRPVVAHRVPRREPIDTALFSLASDTRNREVLPSLHRAVAQADLLHRALVSRLGEARSSSLTGLDDLGAPMRGHRHVHILSLDREQAGRIDHLLLHAPMGFDAAALAAIRSIRRTYTKDADSPLYLTLIGLGVRDDLLAIGDKPIPELASSTVWTTKTPFVPSRHLKARYPLESLVQDELKFRSLPVAIQIEVFDREEVVQHGLHRFMRSRRERPPLQARFFGMRLTFKECVRGPLTLGYGSQFGLGAFVPGIAR